MATANTVLILKIVEIIAFAVGFFLLLLTVIGRAEEEFNRAKKKFVSSQAKRTQKKYVVDYFHTDWARKIDENYKYSRFFTKPVNAFLKTSIGYFVSCIVIAIVSMIILYIVFKNAMVSLIGFGAVLALGFMHLYLLRYSNNKKVESDLITFLNLLGNYSTSSTEVMSIFLQIAPKVQNPLRSCLIECVNESHNSELSTEKVLRNLENKIESPDFKEIVENIIISMKFSSGFVSLCNNERKILSVSLSGKRAIKACVQNNLRIAIICIIMLACMMFPLGGLLDMDIIHATITTTIGKIYIVVIAICILVYIVDLLKVEK